MRRIPTATQKLPGTNGRSVHGDPGIRANILFGMQVVHNFLIQQHQMCVNAHDYSVSLKISRKTHSRKSDILPE